MKLSELECPYCHVRTSEYDGADAMEIYFDHEENTLASQVCVTCSGCGRTYCVNFDTPVQKSAVMIYEDPDDNIVMCDVENDFYKKEVE